MSSFSVEKTRQRMIDSTRAALRDRQNNRVAGTTRDMIADLKQAFNSQRQTARNLYTSKRADLKSRASEEIKYRTISDNSPEDASAMPAQAKDMTVYLFDLNEELERNLDAVVRNIIDSYIAEFGVY